MESSPFWLVALIPLASAHCGCSSLVHRGTFPKILFPQEMEIAIVAGSGLSPIAPENFLQFIGAMQVGSAILALTLKSSALRIVLLLQALGLVLFPILVGYQIPNMWFHPFGPFFKNLPVFIATVEVWKRCK